MTTLLSIEGLSRRFHTPKGTVSAVEDVSFEIARGETVGLVGESGCGKSTLGRVISRILEPTSGSIRLNGLDISRSTQKQMRPLRRKIQFIFQDPFASLNPRASIGRILEEPLIVQGIGTPEERKESVVRLLARVGLSAESASRLPHEFSGGQRQRIGIARALSVSPELIICDEPVSALDLSIQAQVLNLLVDIQRERGLSYLFISHDLSVVRYISDRVMVMYLGRIVESAPQDRIWTAPLHPYTRSLIAAVPVARPGPKADRPAPLEGDLPSPLRPPKGCRFHTRCPLAIDACRSIVPEMRVAARGHRVACHRVVIEADGRAHLPDSGNSRAEPQS